MTWDTPGHKRYFDLRESERDFKKLSDPFQCEVKIPGYGSLFGIAYATSTHDGEPVYWVKMTTGNIAFKMQDVIDLGADIDW